MAFNTTGVSHREGVSMEFEVCDIINDCYKVKQDILNIIDDSVKIIGKVSDVNCIHFGGTDNKKDAQVFCYNRDINAGKHSSVSYTISIKKKKYVNNKPKGTFDVINTTLKKFNDEYKVFDNNKIERIIAWLDSKKPIIHTKNDLKYIRKPFSNLIDELLDSVSNKQVDSFVLLTKKEFFKTDLLIVARTEVKNEAELLTNIYVEKEKNIRLFDEEDLSGNSFYFVKGKGKSSRQVWVKTKKGVCSKTPYRVRLALNNGLGAYYGLSDSNDRSDLTIKIQVDGVTYITDQMECYPIKYL